MVLSFQSLALAVLILLGIGLAILYDRRAKAEAAKLSDTQRARFETDFRDRAARAQMPPELADYAAAHDRAQGGKAGVGLLILVAILVTIL